jgi:F420-dependent oxidoreductase-like protein
MRLSFWTPNTTTWDETLNAAQTAARLGYETIWYADHFMPNAPEPADGATHEAFTMLAAIAATVPGIRVGTMVAGNTYRHPAVLAKIAATLDHISGGQLTLGLGAGWQENEHAAYGIDFKTFGWRFDRLEETLEVLTSLFSQQRTTFAGAHLQITNAPLDPKPVQSPLPILIGGGGEKRTLALTAKYAQQWNVWGTPEVLEQKIGVLNGHCATIGRDPATIHKTAVALLFLSEDAARNAKLRENPIPRPTVIGNAREVAETLRSYQAVGVDEFIVPGFTFRSNADRDETLSALMTDVLPHV